MAPSGMPRALRAISSAFEGWRFPSFVLSLLGAYELLLLVMLLVPAPAGALAAFAEEFRTWCFGYDPATGRMEPMYVVMMLSEPFAIGLIVSLVWWQQLGSGWRRQRRGMLRTAGVSLMLVSAGAAAFGALRGEPDEGELPFPAEALRVSLPTPDFALTDQEGNVQRLSDQRGRVVIVTGVYATCGYTCPMILGQAKRAIAALSSAEQEQVRVLAITLDPEHDTQSSMAQMAAGQKVSPPLFHLLHGERSVVNPLLDRFQIERKRDPDTGVIDHANLFLVIDRRGKLAYRFTLGARQEEWLNKSLRHLLAEAPPGS